MKAHLAHVLESIHGQNRNRQTEVHVRSLQGENIQLQRTLQAKEIEIAELRSKVGNLEFQLQEMTGMDGLTGLPNKQSFKQHLSRSIKRALRLGYSLSLLILDIDRLQEIQTTCGTEISDHILSRVSKILRDSVREVDMAARWSSTELIAVLHETDADGAAMVAERIKKKIRNIDIVDPKSGEQIKINLTLAVAGYMPNSGEAGDLLESVSQTLAAIKLQNSKNCSSLA